jgi:hypothetical protein
MAKQTEKKPDLTKIELNINEFGEIVQNFKTEDLNEFLNDNTENIKLNNHPEFQKNQNNEDD